MSSQCCHFFSWKDTSKLLLHSLSIHVLIQAHLHSLRKSNCKLRIPFQWSWFLTFKVCSKIECIYQLFHLHSLAIHVIVETKKLPMNKSLEYIKLPWLLLDENETFQLVLYYYAQTKQKVYYHYLQKLVAIGQKTTLSHKLLVYEIVIIKNNHLSLLGLFVIYFCL